MASNMATDEEEKHFTDEDLQRLQREERGEGEEGGWSLCTRSETAEVWRKQVPGVPIHMIKVTECRFFKNTFCILSEDFRTSIHAL